MKYLSTLIYLFLIGNAYGYAGGFYDFLNNTSIHVSESRSLMDKDIYYLILKENEWKGQQALNKNVLALVIDIKKSSELKKRLEASMRSNLLYFEEKEAAHYGDTNYNEFKNEIPFIRADNIELTAEPFVLNNTTLIVSFTFSFDPKRMGNLGHLKEQTYHELYYFDLNTGAQIDPISAIAPSKLHDFYEMVKQKIDPEDLAGLTKAEIEKGYPFFSGAHFVYFIKGELDASNEDVNTQQVVFSLAEIQPYLNNKGPFSKYGKIKIKNPKTKCPLNHARYDISLFEADFYPIMDIHILGEQPVKNKIKNSCYYRIKPNGTRDLYCKNTYNEQGHIIKQINYHKQKAIDSTVYTYHKNGELSLIELYDLNYYQDEVFLVESYSYNELGNLIMKKKNDYSDLQYGDYTASEIIVYSYFDDKIIADYFFNGPVSKGLMPEPTLINRIDNYTFVAGGSSNSTPKEFNLTKTDKGFIYKEVDGYNSYQIDYRLKNGKISSGKVVNSKTWEIEVEYNEAGQPTAYYRSYLRGGKIPDARKYEVTYNAEGLPISHVLDRPMQENYKPTRYEIEYNQ